MNYNEICLKIVTLAQSVGDFLKHERLQFDNNRIETKGKNDFVTYLDKASEERIITGLSKIIPESGFIAEEQTSIVKGKIYNWVIDPIDGTTNFIHGLPPYAISIALLCNDELVVGVVHEIVQNETFYAWKDGGAFLNGNPISVSEKSEINDSLIATGFPYSDYTRMDPFIETMKYFFTNSHGLRRIGSAATDLVYVACGRFEAFYEYALKPWDVAAGALILTEAGGEICDFKGGKNYLFGGELIATNKHVFAEMKEIIGSKMNN